MITPVRMGRFLETDAQGFIKPDVSFDLIGDPWKSLAKYVTETLIDTGAVVSVYLRGSVPRGLAIENISDIDFVYLSNSDLAKTEQIIAEHARKHFPFARRVEYLRLDREALDRIIPPRKRTPCHMLLKTQCLFLAGTDVTPDIAPYKPGLEMMTHVFNLANELSILPKLLEKAASTGNTTEIHQWISKRIVRAGFEITMDRSPRFTRDLYLCYEQFAAFYPDYAPRMAEVLNTCLNVCDDHPAEYGDLVALIWSESRKIFASSGTSIPAA